MRNGYERQAKEFELRVKKGTGEPRKVGRQKEMVIPEL